MAKRIRRRQYDEFHESLPATFDPSYRGYARYGDEPREVVVERDHATQAVYLALSLVEAVLGFRLILRLLGASLANPFVQAVYLLSYPLVRPFVGMFNLPFNVPTASLEIATVFAMVLYAVIAYLVVLLIRTIRGRAA